MRRSRRLQAAVDNLARIEKDNDAWAKEMDAMMSRTTLTMPSNAALSGVPKTEPRGPSEAERAGYGTMPMPPPPSPLVLPASAHVAIEIDQVPTPNPSRNARRSCCKLAYVDAFFTYAVMCLIGLIIVVLLGLQVALPTLRSNGTLPDLTPLQAASPILATACLLIFLFLQWLGWALYGLALWNNEHTPTSERLIISVCAWPTMAIFFGLYVPFRNCLQCCGVPE